MAGVRLIKSRIKSAKNIAQITYAMQMVAASKMKKAQARALMGKPYAEKIYQLVNHLSIMVDTSLHQLLTSHDSQDNALIILITTNKGLCGSLNTNIFRKCLNWYVQSTTQKFSFITVGDKGAKFVVRNSYELLADFSKSATFEEAVPPIVAMMVEQFLQGKFKTVEIVFSSFINALNIIPVKKIILPMKDIVTEDSDANSIGAEFLFEPNPKELLDSLLPHYLETQVRSAMLEAIASEHSSRMMAMKSATDNATSLSNELTLIYNRLRQEQITYEIADITRAQLSLTQ